MKRLNRIWLAFFIFWSVMLTGVFQFWLKTPGLRQWAQLQTILTERKQEIAVVEAHSERLRQTESHLENNPAAQEREIRKVLGFVDDSEMVFEFEK